MAIGEVSWDLRVLTGVRVGHDQGLEIKARNPEERGEET